MAWRLRPTAEQWPPIELRDGITTIGRDAAACDIVLPHPGVSKRHCRFRVTGGVLVVEDLGSANGTWANDQRVRRCELKAGDALRLASAVYVVECVESEVAGKGPADEPHARYDDVEIVAEQDGAVVGAGKTAARLDDTQEFRDSASSVRLIESPPQEWQADPESFSNVELLSDSQIEEDDAAWSAGKAAPDEESASNVVLLSDEEAEDSLSNVRLLSDSQLEFAPDEPRHFAEDPARVVDDRDIVDAVPERPPAARVLHPATHAAEAAPIVPGLRDPRSGQPIGLDALVDSRTLDAVEAARQDFLRRGIEAVRAESFAVWEHGQEVGPITYDELRARAASGRLFRGEFVRVQRTGRWVSSERIVGLFPEVDERWLERYRRHWDPRAQDTAPANDDATDDPFRPFDEPDETARSPRSPRGAKADGVALSLDEIRRRGEAWYDADLWGGAAEKAGRDRPGLLAEWLRRHLFKVAGAFVLVMLGLYFLMPASDEDLLRELEAIHGEIVELRDANAGARQWKAFAFRVRQRARPIREVLEATAGPEHPAREHMLQAVRDYLPLMLDDARGRPSDSERWYVFHLEQARRMLQGLPTLEKPPGLQPIIKKQPKPVGAAGEEALTPGIETRAPK